MTNSPGESPSDLDLLKNFSGSNPSPLDVLAARHDEKLRAFVYLFLRDWTSAEEVADDVWGYICLSKRNDAKRLGIIPVERIPAPVKLWLFMLAAHLAWERLTKSLR